MWQQEVFQKSLLNTCIVNGIEDFITEQNPNSLEYKLNIFLLKDYFLPQTLP
jgi:hypothetical protein